MRVPLPSPAPQYDATNESAFRRQVEQAFSAAAPSASVNMLKPYLKADMPDPVPIPGQMIFVTNEAGGAVPAFSDGVSWRRVTDRAVVS